MPAAPKKKKTAEPKTASPKRIVDKREFPRIKSEHVISVRPLTSAGKAVTLTTSKIVGLGGIMFEAGRSFRIHQKLEMTLLAGTELLRLNVRVIWIQKAEEGRWRVGVAFLDITDEMQTKILDLLLRRISLEEGVGL